MHRTYPKAILLWSAPALGVTILLHISLKLLLFIRNSFADYFFSEGGSGLLQQTLCPLLNRQPMSASIFDHKAQLEEPLLLSAGHTDSGAGRRGPGREINTAADDYATRLPAGLPESSSSSLDSSRRTLNQARSAAGESRELELEVRVELSPPPAGPGGRNMAYHAYEDKQGSMEEGEEDTDSRDDLMLGDNFSSKLITNHSGVYRTLPKPFNPG